jgi:hypothetical protein
VNHMHMVAKAHSTHISIILIQVSVPAEDRSHQSATLTHALKGPALTCPNVPLAYQHFRPHFKSYKLLINYQNNVINNKSIHNHNSSTKSHKHKILPSTIKKGQHLKNHDIPSLTQICSCIKEHRS